MTTGKGISSSSVGVALTVSARWEQLFDDNSGMLTIRGWALHPDDASWPVEITVTDGDIVVARGFACERRGDLILRGKGDGFCAFSLNVPADRLGGKVPRVFAGSSELPAPDRSTAPPAGPSLWVGEVTHRTVEDGRLVVRGWVADIARRSSRPEVTLTLGTETWRDFADLPVETPRLSGKAEDCRGFAFDIPIPEGADPQSAMLSMIDGKVFSGALRAPLPSSMGPGAWPPGTFERAGLRGSMALHGSVLRGWIREEGSDAPLAIELIEDGITIWSGTADRLEEVADTDGPATIAHGYRVALPPPRDGRVSTLIDARTADGRRLPFFPIYRFAGDEYFGAIEEVKLEGDEVRIMGWCVNSQRPYAPVTLDVFRADGGALARVVASGTPGPQLRQRTLHAPVGAFDVTVPLKALGSAPQQTVGTLVVAPAGTLRSLPFARRIDLSQQLLAEADRQLFVDHDSRLEGGIDRMQGNVLVGWLRSTAAADQLGYVDLFLDNAWWASLPANLVRGDLARRFGDHGSYGFSTEVQPPQAWQVPGELTLKPRAGRWGDPAAARVELTPWRESKRHAVLSDAQPLADYLLPMPPRATGAHSVSLVVLNRNGAALLERLFTSFAQYNSHRDVEFVIVDHASDDHSARVCAEWQDRLTVRLLQRDGNYSFSQSNNLGAEAATGDVLILANNDARLCEDILPQIVDALEDPSIGVVCPALLDDVPVDSMALAGNPGPIQHLGVHVDLGALGKAGAVPFETRSSREWLGIDARPIEVPAVTGAFMAMRRSDYLAVGGLSEEYFYGHEDIDLVLRLRRKGLRAVALNHLRALHLRAYSRGTLSRDLVPVRLRNRVIFDQRFGVWLRRMMATDRFSRVGYWSGRKLRIAFIVTENDPATMAGDRFTAHELALELSRQFPVDCLFIGHRSPDLQALDGVDVLISMRDDFDPRVIAGGNPALLRVAWVRNWADRFASREWTWDFDVIWASSQHARESLQRDLGRAVELLPIATSPGRFAKGRRTPEFDCDYCFTGSFWGFNREIMQNLNPAALPYRFAVYGHGWEAVPAMAPYSRGALPYDRMPDVYASSRVVIDDANHATKAMGSINSRVFDALASGCLVLTNGRVGAQSIFGDALPTYDSPQELEALLRRYLGDERLRRSTVAQLREIVLSKHTYGDRAVSAWDSFGRASAAPRIAIKIGAPRRDVVAEWGDYHFADSLRVALEELGYRVRIDTLDQWESAQSNGDDVVLVLRGLSTYKPLPHQVSLCWMISHPDKVSQSELALYDHVFVASELFAEQLRPYLGGRISTLLQCTDPARFNPAATDRTIAEEVLFVGNSRGEYRAVIREALEAGIAPAIYGTRWRGMVADRYIKGENVPNTRLAHAYRAAGVVLNDHWETMRKAGFVSNRLFDVLACGGRVVSDPVPGMQTLFGDMVATYTTPAELHDAVEALLSEGPARQAERDDFARRIMAEHSFAARAAVIDGVIKAHFAKAAAGEA